MRECIRTIWAAAYFQYVSACLCTYVCVCVYVCVGVCVCVWTGAWVHTNSLFSRLSASVWVHLCICAYVCFYACVSVSVYMSMYVHLCVYVRECRRVYIYVYVYLNQGIPNISLRRNLTRHLEFHTTGFPKWSKFCNFWARWYTFKLCGAFAVPANPKNLQIIFSKTNQDFQ